MTGYESKRAAAQDKLDDDDTLTIAYATGYYDGKKAAQPEEEKLHPISIGVDVTQAGTSVTAFYRKPDAVMEMFYAQFHPMPQPAQEPVANDRALQLVTYQMNHWRAYALKLQERLVKYEGGAPMLLNKEKNT